MILGEIKTFPHKYPSKYATNRVQALKIIEEAAEVFSQVERGDTMGFDDYEMNRLMDECADVIMATSNLIALFEIDDFSKYIKACEERNYKRGRYND